MSNPEWTKICLDLEQSMTDYRNKINEPLGPISLPTYTTSGDELRNQVWANYYNMTKDRICSRCGDYSKYEIVETKAPTSPDLNRRYGYDFYVKTYDITTTRILNKNSNDSKWGNVCSKCKDHILGKAKHPISSSQLEAERELQFLRLQEHKRQLLQNEEIEAARKEYNKERRENGGRPIKDLPKLNPNDQTNQK